MKSPGAHALYPSSDRADPQAASVPLPLERRGQRWIFGSFAFCPCHLPLTLGILVTVFGGTATGAGLRDHVVLAGAVITAAWVAGTWRGFRLVRLAQQGACPMPGQATGPAATQPVTFGSTGPDGSPITMNADEAGRSQR